MDIAPVTNKEYGKFVSSTYYKTEAEQFGWSFVLSSFLPNAGMLHEHDADPEAEHWVAGKCVVVCINFSFSAFVLGLSLMIIFFDHYPSLMHSGWSLLA